MGWTSYKTKDTFMEVFHHEYGEWLQPSSENRILKSVEMKIPEPHMDDQNEEESEIFSAIQYNGNIYAHVLLINRKDGEVYFKGMDEFSGPYTKRLCPKEILSLLSPLSKFENEYHAKEWRKRQ